VILGNAFDSFALALFAICIIVWPTQLITDRQNRWLRIAAISLIAIQLVIEGPRVQLFGPYFVAALFAILLIPRSSATEPSSVRENREGTAKKLIRWTMVAGTGLLLSVSAALCFLYPRQ
jgi:hypothetical protein